MKCAKKEMKELCPNFATCFYREREYHAKVTLQKYSLKKK